MIKDKASNIITAVTTTMTTAHRLYGRRHRRRKAEERQNEGEKKQREGRPTEKKW